MTAISGLFARQFAMGRRPAMKRRPALRRPASRQLPSRQRGQRGFSLIEVMIATGVFAMLAGLLFAALWSGQAQVARMSRSASEEEQLLTARRVLKSWIEAATVAGLAGAAPRGQAPQALQPLFVGEPKSFTFHATPAERDGSSGLYRIEVSVSAGSSTDSRNRLAIARQRLNVLTGQPVGSADTADLLVTASPLVFSYGDERGTGPGGEGQRWSELWEEPGRLPTRIQIGDPRAPVMTVQMAISKDPRCVLIRGVETMAGGDCAVR